MKIFAAFLAVLMLSSLAVALKVGELAPLPTVKDSFGKTIKLEADKGKWIVLFFYPRAFTSGCTAQNIEYTKRYQDFLDAGAVVYGVSNDASAKQCDFVKKYALKIPQIPDTKFELAKAFDVASGLGLYSRDTVIIAPSGKVNAIKRGVNAVSDAAETLEFVQRKGDCKVVLSGTVSCG
jgi:thioredoxin-dependent peroxiredoxin